MHERLLMADIHERTMRFLNDHCISADYIDIDTYCRAFLQEMEKGLQEEPDGSLAMIPTYTSADAHIKAGDKVIVLDAGGTNFRVCSGHLRYQSASDHLPLFQNRDAGGEAARQRTGILFHPCRWCSASHR